MSTFFRLYLPDLPRVVVLKMSRVSLEDIIIGDTTVDEPSEV